MEPTDTPPLFAAVQQLAMQLKNDLAALGVRDAHVLTFEQILGASSAQELVPALPIPVVTLDSEAVAQAVGAHMAQAMLTVQQTPEAPAENHD